VQSDWQAEPFRMIDAGRRCPSCESFRTTNKDGSRGAGLIRGEESGSGG
jgi:hypothetical protein